MNETDNGPFYFDANERIRALEESNTLLRAEMNKLEDENSTLKRRMGLMNEYSKLFEQCEVMRKAIDANIHRMSEIEKMIGQLEGL
jgi:predicted nuclease with TOPRIM domain